jgi:hypothetical protein
MSLFKKVACFTDIHFGLKSNSQTHNQDCLDFVDWYIAEAKQAGCDTGMFMGDWHHNRNSLNITTMDYSLRALEKLGQAFDQFFFFPGNHDLYYKDKRDIHSVEFGKYIPGITIVHEPVTIGEVTMCPWLVGDEWKHIGKKHTGKYIFGHFELPNFFMNAMVQMPDHGEIQLDNFKEYELGFSGHFHKRQQQGNMIYIGNAFPHNYADAWDDERGMMILEWGKQPEYLTWPEQPTFRTTKLSELIDNASIIKPKQHLRVALDIDVSYEEASFIKEKFLQDYAIRELTLIAERKETQIDTNLEIQAFESVDEIVANQITSIESDAFNKITLLEIYNSL